MQLENLQVEIDIDDKRCIICGSEDSLENSIPDYEYCNRCFHIARSSLSKTSRNISINVDMPDFTRDYVLSKIKSLNFSDKKPDSIFKILILNDKDSSLIDETREILSQKINKYYLKTISVSPFYNSSFFSKHKHYKLTLTDYTFQMLKEEYEFFDLIVLNDTLTYTQNPIQILKYCNELSNDNTKILCCNLSTNVLRSMELLNMNKNVKNIFNTDSLKKSATVSGLFLENVESIKEGETNFKSVWLGSTISKVENNNSKSTVEQIYNEIEYDLYSTSTHKSFRLYWLNYFSKVNSDLKKYRKIGYTIVLVGNHNIKDLYANFINDIYIQREISNKIIFEVDIFGDDQLVLILDYKNTDRCLSKNTTGYLPKNDQLIYDPYNLIAYHLDKWILSDNQV